MLSTKEIKTSNGNSPVLKPGNHVVKINAVYLSVPPYNSDAYDLVFEVESEPVGGDFKGFLIDSNNENGPRYQGQVARVNSQRYPFADTVLKNGNEINRDQEILKMLVKIAEALDLRDSLDQITAGNIEEFVKRANQIFKNGKYFNICIAGREWENNQGYINYNLFLPKFNKNKLALENLDIEDSKLIQFNEEEHIIKIKAKTISNFSSDAEDDDDDFDLF